MEEQDLNATRSHWRLRHWAAVLLAGFFCAISNAQGLGDAANSIGLNKFDLPKHYVGRPREAGNVDDPGYRRVQRALAQKILADAKDVGVRLIRTSIPGYGPISYDTPGDLDMWRTRPAEFWARVDEMMEDLDANQIRLVPVLMWNARQFPAMNRETVADLVNNRNSRSWQMLSRFVTEFVTRYRGRRTIEFYELTNELNLLADIDNVGRCSRGRKPQGCDMASNISTEDIIAFTERYARLIRSLDGGRRISSGFSVPRAEAESLRSSGDREAGSRRKWGGGSVEELAKNLLDLHRHVDIVSVHLYEADRNKRFGGDETRLLTVIKQITDRSGKTLFVGEFGDENPESAGPGSYVPRMIRTIKELNIPYSAVWVWQFRAANYLVQDERPKGFSLDPGYTDYLISEIRRANSAPALASSADRVPPYVVLTSPLPCAAWRPNGKVYVAASDGAGPVRRVELLVDGVRVAEDDKVPYEFQVPSSAMPDGKRRITARAVDNAGNASEFTSEILVGRTSEACAVR